MSGFTKQAIQASFLKLLDTYPLRDITVRMITEDCGINRKSFYYHYQDIPALLEQILADQAAALVASYQSVRPRPVQLRRQRGVSKAKKAPRPAMQAGA